MNKIDITIWERKFQLDAVLECYPNETILDFQENTYEWIKSEPQVINDSKSEVEKYIINNDAASLPNGEIDNIFKYVMPKSFYIPHCEKNNTFALLCDYKFDIEHGLAIVFENGKYQTIGSEDIIL